MRYTPNYNMVIGEGTDAVNPLTQIFPNFETIDSAMENNKNAGITTASEVSTGGVHAIVRVNTSAPVFRFTATSAWTTGDTMTLDGSAVTVHLTDGTAPKSGAYVIGAEVVGIVNGSLVTLLAGASFDGVLSFNSRQGVVTPQSGDYTANMIGYNNTSSGLSATDAQAAIDEIASKSSFTLVGSIVGDTPIQLPATFNELYITTEVINHFSAVTIMENILAATDKRLCIGNGAVEFDIDISKTAAHLAIVNVSGTDYKSSTTLTIYYR